MSVSSNITLSAYLVHPDKRHEYILSGWEKQWIRQSSGYNLVKDPY